MIHRKALGQIALTVAALGLVALTAAATPAFTLTNDCLLVGHDDFFWFDGWWDLGSLGGLARLAIHLLFGAAVYRDARRLEGGPGTTLVGVWVWTLATLIGGAIVAAIYWAMNRSTLRPEARASAS